MSFTYEYVGTTIPRMLAQAYTLLRFLKTILDLIKSEFTVSLKRKLLLLLFSVFFFFPFKFKIFLQVKKAPLIQ